jgi:hypothetical protein
MLHTRGAAGGNRGLAAMLAESFNVHIDCLGWCSGSPQER